MKVISILLTLFSFIYSKMEQTPNKFGKKLLPLFFLDPNYVNTNHGSYGSPPREVVYAARNYQEQMDANPDLWIRYLIDNKLLEVRKLVGDYVSASPEDIVMIENASDGISSIFKSILKTDKDKILYFDISYVNVKSTIKFLNQMYGVVPIEIKITNQTLNSNEEILLKNIEDTIIENLPITLANIDHITSAPSTILPVKKIIAILKKYSIISFIDGAHVVGQIPLNITDLDPDFYISNFHKWGYAPKSASFLYVKKSLQYIPHPLIITGRFGNGFPNEYQYTGTRDNSAYLAVKDSLEFRKKYGDKDIMEYMHELSIKAGELVAEIFGTEVLIKDTNKFGSINNIRMPIDNADLLQKAVNNTLFEDNTYVTNIEFDGHFYMRISCQIYNELNDYKYAANKFMKQLAKLNQNSES